MPECTKAYLQQYKISFFPGEDPRAPFRREERGREGVTGGKKRERGRGEKGLRR